MSGDIWVVHSWRMFPHSNLNLRRSAWILYLFQLYGLDAAFYKLSTLCLDDVRSGKYSYSVCPFGPVKQKDSGRAVLIGQSPQWVQRGPAAYRLLLSDGESTNCPGSETRKTTVSLSYFIVSRRCDMKRYSMPVGITRISHLKASGNVDPPLCSSYVLHVSTLAFSLNDLKKNLSLTLERRKFPAPCICFT